MPNRHDRRAEHATRKRELARAARLRCVGCERSGQKMTREHLFPLWLIKHAKVFKEGISWAGRKGVNPKTATMPLCVDCNSRLGAELEGPVSKIFPRIETEEEVSDYEAELLIRWLWKFCGLTACYAYAGDPDWRYSSTWTLIERVLGEPFNTVRRRLCLAIGLIHANDPDFHDWPVGLDSEIGAMDTFFIAGVFGRVALLTCLNDFAGYIPGMFATYNLAHQRDVSGEVVLYPPVCFPFGSDAINVMREISPPMKRMHEAFALNQHPGFISMERPRIIIPG